MAARFPGTGAERAGLAVAERHPSVQVSDYTEGRAECGAVDVTYKATVLGLLTSVMIGPSPCTTTTNPPEPEANRCGSCPRSGRDDSCR